MSGSTELVCSVCQKTYSRLDHLQRHLLAHTPHRPFECDACGKGFKRKDVLSRHFATCRVKNKLEGGELNHTKTFRSTKKACDRCAAQKRACDSGHPCTSCVSKGKSCTYNWLETDTVVNATDINIQRQGEPESRINQVTQIENSSTFGPPNEGIGDVDTDEDALDEYERHILHAPEALWGFLDEPAIKRMRIEAAAAEKLDFSGRRSPSAESESNDIFSPGQNPAGSFAFFKNFLNSNARGLIESFEIHILLSDQPYDDRPNKNTISEANGAGASVVSSSTAERQSEMTHGDALQNLSPNIWLLDDSSNPFPAQGTNSSDAGQMQNLFSFSWPTPSEVDYRQWEELRTAHIASIGSPDSGRQAREIESILKARSLEIVHTIRKTVNCQSRNSVMNLGDWSSLLEDNCANFFCAANLHRFLEFFWARWYPNVPTIHKPAFDAATAPPPLLASMALLGACVSPNLIDRDEAKFWLDVVEEMVFNDPTLNNFASTSRDGPDSAIFLPRLRAIQAAYTICVTQNWEGNTTARVRIRRQRYGMVISAARDVMCYANHKELENITPESFQWQQFIATEELIRSVLYVFLLDTAFTIFNNTPPRMVMRELTLDLACPEPCFQAETGIQCFHMIKRWTSHHLWPKRLPLCTALRLIRQVELDPDNQQYFAQSGILNLWVITSAFHILLFNVEPGFGSRSLLLALKHAITNWRVVWNLRFSDNFVDGFGVFELELSVVNTSPKPSWKRVGFMRNAPEYWLLARLILGRLESAERSMEAAEDLSGLLAPQGSIPASILPKYDETDMGQLDSFISSFQDLKMSE